MDLMDRFIGRFIFTCFEVFIGSVIRWIFPGRYRRKAGTELKSAGRRRS
jgi:hypothetical protein